MCFNVVLVGLTAVIGRLYLYGVILCLEISAGPDQDCCIGGI